MTLAAHQWQSNKPKTKSRHLAP